LPATFFANTATTSSLQSGSHAAEEAPSTLPASPKAEPPIQVSSQAAERALPDAASQPASQPALPASLAPAIPSVENEPSILASSQAAWPPGQQPAATSEAASQSAQDCEMPEEEEPAEVDSLVDPCLEKLSYLDGPETSLLLRADADATAVAKATTAATDAIITADATITALRPEDFEDGAGVARRSQDVMKRIEQHANALQMHNGYDSQYVQDITFADVILQSLESGCSLGLILHTPGDLLTNIICGSSNVA
jgi:hypothetical protein